MRLQPEDFSVDDKLEQYLTTIKELRGRAADKLKEIKQTVQVLLNSGSYG